MSWWPSTSSIYFNGNRGTSSNSAQTFVLDKQGKAGSRWASAVLWEVRTQLYLWRVSNFPQPLTASWTRAFPFNVSPPWPSPASTCPRWVPVISRPPARRSNASNHPSELGIDDVAQITHELWGVNLTRRRSPSPTLIMVYNGHLITATLGSLDFLEIF